MSLLPILAWPDSRLARTCDPVTEFGTLGTLVEDMFETMYAAPGRGLAAPQVGVMRRLFVMDPGWKDGTPAPLACLNPEIVARAGEKVAGTEACLSIPGISAEVPRHARITLRWQDTEGASHEAGFEGFAAACAQHELDHLDGITILDRVDKVERQRLESAYRGLAAR